MVQETVYYPSSFEETIQVTTQNNASGQSRAEFKLEVELLHRIKIYL